VEAFYSHEDARKVLLYPVDKAADKTNLGGVGMITEMGEAIESCAGFRSSIIDTGRVRLNGH
jgi:hypothetical protein